MKTPILKSRRFWMMMVDVVVSVITFFAGNYFILEPKTVDLIKFMVVTLQPVTISLIVAYTVDDTVQAISDHKIKMETLKQSK